MIAKVTVYRNFLVITAIKTEKSSEFIPAGNGNIGCLVFDTEKNLGVSKEAVEWLKKLRKSNDAIGDIDCFEETASKKWVFGWLGGFKRVYDKAENFSGSRTWDPKFPHLDIPNDTTDQEAIDAIEAILKEE